MELLKFLFGLIINLDLLALVLLAAIGIFCLKDIRKRTKMILLSCVFVLVFILLLPFSRVMLHQLEHRFPQQSELPKDAHGLILLGGSFSLRESQLEGRPIYNLAAGRIIEFISLARRHPNLPILFTGTSLETELAKRLFDEMGIDLKRVTFENQSRSTYDNAYNSYKLLKPTADQKWVLVTSAFHMPRSVGLFRGAGWNVIPYPVDYHIASLALPKILWGFFDRQNAAAWGTVAKEWAGLFNGYIAGSSPQFFPR